MTSQKKGVTLITKVDLENDIGVLSKLREIQNTLRSYGYSPQIQNVRGDNVPATIMEAYRKIQQSNSKIIIIRSFGVLNTWLLPIFILCRLKGVLLIMDMPTPRYSALHEMLPLKKGIGKFSYLFQHYMHGPWSLWVYNRVIQYGNESRYFLFGNKKRTVLMGNSIDVNRIAVRERNYDWPTDELKLIAVAKLSNHHGYDRLLTAIRVWNSSNKDIKLTLTLIGDGNMESELRRQVEELDVKNCVIMPGRMETKAIHEQYSTHHLAVSSLGLYRLGLHCSGVLKAREYCLAGIPFLAAGDDPDFDASCPFRYEVKNEDEVDSILEQIELFLETRDQYTDQEIRDYAIKHLSFESKLERMGIPDLRDHRE